VPPTGVPARVAQREQVELSTGPVTIVAVGRAVKARRVWRLTAVCTLQGCDQKYDHEDE
jgi:hypothetical protein